MQSINFTGCKACDGSGDWRGWYAKSKLDFKLGQNICLHCGGTGEDKSAYHDKCKYCLEPCNGYACKRCLQTFEAEKEFEEDIA